MKPDRSRTAESLATLGKYAIQSQIGSGPLGVVYRASDEGGRPVALKVMIPGETASEEHILRFEQKARVAAHLLHPNIVRIHEVGADGPLHYVAMELVEGTSLQRRLEDGPLDVRHALEIAESIALALRFAHARAVIHRNLKPPNILIDPQGLVRLSDFGVDRAYEDTGNTPTRLTAPAMAHLSPEQAFQAPEEVDARSDLWSLGVLLFEMLTGRPPFEGVTPLAILRQLEDESPPPPSGLNPAVPAALDALVLKLLEKNPAERLGSADEAANALKRCLGGCPAGAKDARQAPPTRARPILLLALLLVAMIGIGVWILPRPGGTSSKGGDIPPDPVADVRREIDEAVRSKEAALRRAHLQGALRVVNRTRLDPATLRLRSEVYRRRGSFSLAARDLDRVIELEEKDIESRIERVFCRAASVRALPFLMTPGLWPTADAEELRREIETLRRLGASIAQTGLLLALHEALEGDFKRAEEELQAVASSASRPRLTFVRAHLEIRRSLSRPSELEWKKSLVPIADALRLDADEPSLLPLLILITHLSGEDAAAEEPLARLRAEAPDAAETFLMEAIFDFLRGSWERGWSRFVEASLRERLDLREVPIYAFVHVAQLLGDPMSRERQDEFIGGLLKLCDAPPPGDTPLELFLRAWLRIASNRLGEAEELTKRLQERLGGSGVHLPCPELTSLAKSPGRIGFLQAACETDLALRRTSEAIAVCDEILKILPPEKSAFSVEEHHAALEAHVRLALLRAEEPESALGHLEEAFKLGWPVERAEAEAALRPLHEDPRYLDLLRKYRKP